MPVKEPTLEVTEDNQVEFMKTINSFRNDNVLVGIPSTDSNRNDNSPINNATILAINEFGSPVNNIPPRPVMAIGIRLAQDAIAAEFAKAAKGAWTKGVAAINQYYERAGIIASNSIKRVINEQIDIEGPAEATLKGRESRGFKGTKALIVTGQLRNAITYVIRRGLI